MTKKRSPWFPPEVNPVYPGVYERRSMFGSFFARFDGKKWYCGYILYELAKSCRTASINQNRPWRGLAEKPEGMK